MHILGAAVIHIDHITSLIKRLRTTKPLVLNLTNYVTMDIMANSLLALGAPPIMTVCDEELEELIHISGSVYINIGTLDTAFIQRCHAASAIAVALQKPIILDPVGAGASRIRTETAITIMPHVDIVRGNASEILALKNTASQTQGVEAIHTTSDASQTAIETAKTYDCTVVISGPVDFITNGSDTNHIPYGSPLMPLITGMGCALTAVIAAFHAVESNAFAAATAATTYFGVCGQYAGHIAKHPGTFRTAFIDTLHAADFNVLRDIYAE